jgi:hypothetical protein
MMMLTRDLIRRLPKIYSQDGNADAPVVVKFFCPWNQWTWYATEGEPEGDDWRFFGFVVGHEEEVGYFMLSELMAVRGPGGLKIELDLHWDPTTPMSKVQSGEAR